MTKQDLQKEVLELHQFFEDWFTGRLANTDKNFRRFADVMADDFEIISPSGNRTARDALLQGLRHAHGSRKNAEKPFRIWIENIRVRNLERGLSLVTYEEWQETDTGTKGRLSTALFRQKSGAPNGAEWVHVHETWIGG